MKLNLRRILFLLAALTGIVAVFMIFVSPLKFEIEFLGVRSVTEIEWKDFYFEYTDTEKACWPAVVGFGLILIGSLVALASAFKKMKANDLFLTFLIIVIFCGGGAVLINFMKDLYIFVNGLDGLAAEIVKAFDYNTGAIMACVLSLVTVGLSFLGMVVGVVGKQK